MANIARTANVASLNFWSAIVAAARIASTAYAPKATHNRFIEDSGAQGRIRTSVARKERQIYSLLPLTTRPPVHASTEHPALSPFLRAQTWARNCQISAVKEHRSPNASFRNPGKSPQRPRVHTSTRDLRFRKLLLESVL